jgi:polysaccharide biosynthesis transport protein
VGLLTQAAARSREPGFPGMSGQRSPESSDVITLPELVRVFRRRRQLIASSVIALLILGALYCVVKTRRYEAVTNLAINPEGSNSLDMGDITATLGGGGLGFDEKLATQVLILKSDSLAWTVISELRLDKRAVFAGDHKFLVVGPYSTPDAPEQIEQTSPERRNKLLLIFSKALKVDSIPHTEAVEVSFRSPDAALARDVVNRLAKDYSRRSFTTRFEDTMEASHWLSGQLDDLRTAMDQSEAKLAAFQRRTGIFGTDENDNLVLSRLDDLSKELTDAESDRIVKEAKYRVSQSGNPELIGTIVPDSVLPVLRQQEAGLKDQLAQADAMYGSQYPKVVQLRAQIAQLDKSLQKEIADIQERFREDYQTSANAERQLRTVFADQKKQANNMSLGLSQYGMLKRDLESDADLYEDLQKKLKEAGAVASLKALTVDIIDPAILTTKPVEPNIPLAMALSLILGLGLGGGSAFLAESLDDVIRSADEIEILTDIPLFGFIPHRKRVLSKDWVQGNEPDGEVMRRDVLAVLLRPTSHHSEAFSALRTSLLLASAGTPPKTILITSAVPEEGKSTLSVNLALVLVKWGARVLLVDADLRRGVIRERFKLSKNFGLSGSLTGAGNWQDAVLPLPEAPNLSILQAGLRPPNPGELLGSPQMSQVIQEWKPAYDYVIIDSAPSLLVTDAVLIAQNTDATLLVSRVGITTRVGLRRVGELLRAKHVHVAGMVINDVAKTDQYYGYGYGYGAYNGYYSDENPD